MPSLSAQIRYEPALPAERQHLTQCLPIGHMMKFIVTYPTVSNTHNPSTYPQPAYWLSQPSQRSAVTSPTALLH